MWKGGKGITRVRLPADKFPVEENYVSLIERCDVLYDSFGQYMILMDGPALYFDLSGRIEKFKRKIL